MSRRLLVSVLSDDFAPDFFANYFIIMPKLIFTSHYG